MKKLILSCLGFLFYGMLSAQTVARYDMEVDIRMETKSVAVSGFITIDWQDADSISLVLWKETEIHQCRMETGNVPGYRIDTSQTPVMYIPNGGIFVIYRTEKSPQNDRIYLNYTCDMSALEPWFGKSFEPEWLEIGFYTAWYPVHMDSMEFTSTVKVTIDGDMRVDGSGIVSHDADSSVTTIETPWASSDMVILASRTLNASRVSDDNFTAEIISVDLPRSDIDSMLAETRSVFDYYSELLGIPENGYVKFAIPPGGRGSGYGRPNFIVLRTGSYDPVNTSRGIAHEMAHFWFTGAPVLTWEDWLNESFAEYLCMRYLKHKTGRHPDVKYRGIESDTWIELYLQTTLTGNAPPIYGVDRMKPEAYAALYEYGSLMMYEFECLVGEQKFTHFLRDFLANNITSTRDFMIFLENGYQPWVPIWFARKLGLPEDFMDR